MGFVQTISSVSEEDSTPGIQVCVEIVAGTVDSDGLIINVVNDDGGTATGES